MDTLQPDTQPETPIDSFQPTGAINNTNEVNMISLQGYFGNQSPTFEEKEAMAFIYQFYQDLGINEMATVLMSIRGIENKLGSIPLDMTRSQAVFQYLKLQKSISQMTEQAKGMERGW